MTSSRVSPVRLFSVLDKITGLTKSENDVRPITELSGYEHGIDVAKYALEHSFMYGGKVESITLKLKNDFEGNIFDTFGSSARISAIPNDESFSRVTVKCTLEGMRLWAMQYSDVCEVLEPQRLRDEIKNCLSEAIKKYD